MRKKKLVFFLYNRLNDPLIQSNIFLYIAAIADKKQSGYQIVIITFEDKKHKLSKEDSWRFSEMFKKNNIRWIPLAWTKGDQIHRKVRDLVKSFFTVLSLRIRGFDHFVTLGTIAGSFIYLISRIVPIKYYLYQYEPHSEYALDNGIWSKESNQFKLLNYFERKAAQSAKIISSGTDFMRNRLLGWKVKADFFKVASVVDDKKFYYSVEERGFLREKLGISSDKKVIIYPGKLGDLYCSPEQLLDIFLTISSVVNNSFFVVISPSYLQLEQKLNEYPQLKRKTILLPPVDHTEMRGYLSMADLGVIAVLPGPSKKFVSNIKVGEYLCSGLPYLICNGISEDDKVANTYNVGIVIDSFNGESIKEKEEELNNIFSVQKEVMALRCRQIGVDYRGFDMHYKRFICALESFFK